MKPTAYNSMDVRAKQRLCYERCSFPSRCVVAVSPHVISTVRSDEPTCSDVEWVSAEHGLDRLDFEADGLVQYNGRYGAQREGIAYAWHDTTLERNLHHQGRCATGMVRERCRPDIEVSRGSSGFGGGDGLSSRVGDLGAGGVVIAAMPVTRAERHQRRGPREAGKEDRGSGKSGLASP